MPDTPAAQEASQPPSAQPRRWVRRAADSLLWCLITMTFLLGYGISSADAERLEAFVQGVQRWQTDPEFRQVGMEYALLSHDAMQVHFWGISTTRLVMTIRSIPGLPKAYAVEPTSQVHYDNFTRGPLSAYMHLCSEQNVADRVGMLEELGKRGGTLSEADLLWFLDGFKMDFPVVKDDGAIQSVRLLVEDVGPAQPLAIREKIDARVRSAAQRIAMENRLPALGSGRMTPQIQRTLLDQLDSYLRTNDTELWRTKQLNDFCNGVWAQVYGPVYNSLIVPVLTIRLYCRVAAPVLFLCMLILWTTRTRPAPQPAAAPARRHSLA